MRLRASIFCTLCLLASPALAQEPAAEDPPAWEFSISGATYFVPEDSNYLQPTFTADRDWLHLEARYNYEASDTASAWLGYNLSGGEDWAWELTPMIGGVFGDTSGIAPGYKGSLSWRKIEFYSEGELMFDTGESSDSFFYNWSELSLAPVESFRFGLVTQRTRAYQSERDLQRGLLAGFSFRKLSVAGYVFNPDDEKPTYVLSVALTF